MKREAYVWARALTATGTSLTHDHKMREPSTVDEPLQFAKNRAGIEAPTSLTSLDGKHDRAGLARAHGDDEPPRR